MKETITAATKQAVTELLAAAKMKPGQLFVVGCSSSEIAGGVIGHASSMDCAEAVYEGIAPILAENGLYLCAQCCEHLNRAIIMEREAAEKYGYEIVCVVPQPKAGGSFATTVWKNMKDPVAVEEVEAHAGIDIGGTLIGMHLRRVAVPVRLSLNKIGEANILCARTRPKFIGGIRARYEDETER
ncbi:MAG: TIGR01440 family protein [Clostridia bacterium]|nr:TIGR01440 family protein [Clostridia bacterium]